jgi:transcriptional regulator with PAS, ATPase and Fis domain
MVPKIQDYVDDEFCRLVFDQLDGMAVVDADGRYIYVNQTWSELMGGIELGQIKGKYVHDLFPETKIDEVLKTGKPAMFGEVNLLNNKGKAFGNFMPVKRDGVVIGGFFHIILRNMEEAHGLFAEIYRLTTQLAHYKNELKRVQGAKYTLENIIGESPPILNLRHELRKVSRSSSTVLIYGETGCGKELAAHAIHNSSVRCIGPFVKVNCAAIPIGLMESEFFGYESGAFTGAKKSGQPGKFELARGGCLFLDEINHLPLEMQPKLLRVLQEKEVERVGGRQSIPIDVRIIAATNVPLDDLVKARLFRSDLFYRLNVMHLRIPPLREHLQDIPLLCDILLERLNNQLGMHVPEVSAEVKRHFMLYHWPGNVRELQNVLERGMNMAWQDIIRWEHVRDYFRRPLAPFPSRNQEDELSIREGKRKCEFDMVMDALARCDQNKTKAAACLGISRSLLHRKLKKLGLSPQKRPCELFATL